MCERAFAIYAKMKNAFYYSFHFCVVGWEWRVWCTRGKVCLFICLCIMHVVILALLHTTRLWVCVCVCFYAPVLLCVLVKIFNHFCVVSSFFRKLNSLGVCVVWVCVCVDKGRPMMLYRFWNDHQYALHCWYLFIDCQCFYMHFAHTLTHTHTKGGGVNVICLITL